MRILIAEDEMMSRHVLERSLQGWGYEVVVARDGNEAWEELQKDDRPQLAILDWMMPGMEGIEICRRLRGEVGRPYVFVLMLTARERKEDIAVALLSGADDFISKPFDHLELEARLRTGRRVLALEERLTHEAAHDALTGALNRAAVEDQLVRELARGEREGTPTSVLMFDLDHFKSINDRFGHPTGDLTLVEATRRAKDVIRPFDSLGRWGGEEFVVVLPGCAEEEATSVGERIRRSFAEATIPVPSGVLRFTASFGVCSGRGSDSAAFFRAADAALYRAKNRGRNRIEASPLGVATFGPVRSDAGPVLLVDDHAHDRRMALEALSRIGHTVLEARTLPEARAVLAQTVPALILVDVRVPGGTSQDLLDEIRAEPRLSAVPVVVVTAMDIPDAAAQLDRVGFDAYVPKPIAPDAFARQIELLLAMRACA